MAGVDASAMWELVSSLQGLNGNESIGSTEQATCTRVDNDGTVWVRLLGADIDTPVNGQRLADVVIGDNVTVTIEDGLLSVIGNSSRPSTSASHVEEIVGPVVQKVTEVVNVVADKASVGELQAATARIGELEADHVAVDDLTAVTGRIQSLESDHVSVADFQAEQANIDTLQANTADIDTIRANSAKVQNLTAAQLEADHATIGTLDTTYATIANLNAANGRITNLESTKANISDLEANYITADEIEATYMHANLSNSDVAWIENGTIKNGAIVSAMINDVSANKLTAGTINGSVINVTNLSADNITTGTINGQRIGEGSLSLSKLDESVYTEAEVNSIVDGLNDRIDGAIETFTGTVVPTLNNSPASSWNTAKLRDEHVGDVYYVVNSQSQQNGYCYRFTKSGSTYSWQLIKDSDVTAALQRISAAEGKITTFDSDISTLKTDTGTLTTRTTNLETRADDVDATLLDKVDVTTFNEVSDTVDAHTQTISQHTTAISNKADSSTVTAVTNRVSKNEQDISGINTTIGELQDTVETKADGSTVSTISSKLNTVSDTVDGHTQAISSVQNTLSTKADSSTVSTLTTKVNTVSDTVDGHTQRLSSVEDTLETKADGSTVSTISTKVNNISDTVDGHTSQLQSVTSTQTSMQSTLDKTVKSSIQLWYSKANTTAPSKPTSQVTSTSTDGGAWRTVVPSYNASYPNYYYCWQYEYADGTYGWSAVVRDIAMGESQATARTADSNASAAQNTANANIKSSVQLWFTKADGTAPSKPTSVVSTSNANTANAWNLVVPVWNSSYPHYYYCYQQQKGDGTYQWTDVVYDRATSEAQQLANTTSTNLSTLQTNYATFKQTTEQFESTVGSRLTTIESDIDGVEERVSDNETSISNNASAIALKANSADVYTKTAVDGKITQEVTDRNAAITAKANEITSTVSQNYTTKQEFADLEVGGRNLLKYSRDYSQGYSGNVGTDSIDGTYQQCLVWKHAKSQTSRYEEALTTTTSIVSLWTVRPDEDYVLSFWAKASASLSIYSFFYYSGNNTCDLAETSTGYKSSSSPDGSAITNIGTEWARYWVHWHFGSNTDPTKRKNIIVARMQDAVTGTVWIAGPKLEKGTRATDWSPAPEDTEERVNTAESSITQNATNINAKVSKNDVINQINLSTEGVLIDAERVEIDGPAVFNAISSNVDTAITNKGYATTSQAQSYATTAKTEAISTSAADATAKANAVQANLDNLEIGGRNLLAYSGTGKNWSYSTFVNGVYTRSTTATSESYVSGYTVAPLELGETYTFSAWMKTNGQVSSVDMFLYDHAVRTIRSKGLGEITTEWAFYMFTVTMPDSWVSGTNTVDGWTARFDNKGSKTSGTEAILYVRKPKLEKGNKATDWTPAPEDLQSSAVSRTQRIYYRWNSATVPAAPTSWVTKGDDGSALWTKMHVAITSTHKYIYTCEQYVMADGTIGHTDVLLDNTITVIDGGNIITGTVTANKLNASDINASKTLTVGAMTDAAAATILNSNVKVGGRNLLRNTGNYNTWDVLTASVTYFTKYDDYIKFTPPASAQWWTVEPHSAYIPIGDWDASGTYTVSIDVKFDNLKSAPMYPMVALSAVTNNTTVSYTARVYERSFSIIPTTNDWTHFEYTVSGDYTTWTKNTSGTPAYIKVYIWLFLSSSNADAVSFRNLKLEKGNKPTDWSPAPEDSLAEEQYIYISSASGTTSINKNTTWVTQSSDVQNVWTTKRPTYSSSYPVLFVAKQSKTAGGAVSCTTPVKDDTTTVIDGGHITTGTIDTNRLNADTIKSNIVQTTDLSATQITSGDISADRIKANVIGAINSLTAGQIDAARINASQLTIGQSQVTNLTSDLSAKASKSDVAWAGTCDTAAGTAAKEVVCDDFTASELTMGATICVRFNAANTSSAAITLNVNGTGAKPISVATGATSATNQLLWASGATIRFMYNTSLGQWRVADTTPTYYSTCSVGEGVAAKTAGCAGCVIFKGVAIHIIMTAANTNTSATLNVNSTGAKAIYYGNTTTRPTTANEYGWKAGATASFVFDGAYWRYADASAMYQSADAAKTASNYITTIDTTNGIKIANASPSSATTYLQLASTFLDFIRGGVSMLKAWVDGSVAKVRVGAEQIDGTDTFNTLTDGEGIKLRNGTTVLGQFASNLIELGKNSTDAVIKLCGGLGQIKYKSDYNDGALLISNSGGLSQDVHLTAGDGATSATVGVHTSQASMFAYELAFRGDLLTFTDFDDTIVSGYQIPVADVINAIPVTLYDNASASASAATTLSETAANFKRLTIFYKDTDNTYGSVDVWNPNGKRVSLDLTWINGASTQQMYQRVRWVTISGTAISTAKGSGDSKYRTGQVRLGGSYSVTNSDYISIVHVIGYR